MYMYKEKLKTGLTMVDWLLLRDRLFCTSSLTGLKDDLPLSSFSTFSIMNLPLVCKRKKKHNFLMQLFYEGAQVGSWRTIFLLKKKPVVWIEHEILSQGKHLYDYAAKMHTLYVNRDFRETVNGRWWEKRIHVSFEASWEFSTCRN